MVKGTFMCLGSPQYLKNKFGNFYILKVKLKTPDKLQDFKNFITMTFPGKLFNFVRNHHPCDSCLYYQLLWIRSKMAPKASCIWRVIGLWGTIADLLGNGPGHRGKSLRA